MNNQEDEPQGKSVYRIFDDMVKLSEDRHKDNKLQHESINERIDRVFLSLNSVEKELDDEDVGLRVRVKSLESLKEIIQGYGWKTLFTWIGAFAVAAGTIWVSKYRIDKTEEQVRQLISSQKEKDWRDAQNEQIIKELSEKQKDMQLDIKQILQKLSDKRCLN